MSDEFYRRQAMKHTAYAAAHQRAYEEAQSMEQRFARACKHDSDETTTGVEIPGVYDGVLFWKCEVCGAMWHRWYPSHTVRSGRHPINTRLHVKAREIMESWHADAEQDSAPGVGGSATAAPDVPELGQ